MCIRDSSTSLCAARLPCSVAACSASHCASASCPSLAMLWGGSREGEPGAGAGRGALSNATEKAVRVRA
eukprot:370604-Alexandrium_andersonii.AAC.1